MIVERSTNVNSRVSGTIRRCGVDDAAMLHRLSVETYVDTFDGTSSDEDMEKYLEETYAEPVLRKELANPDSVFFVILMPSGAQTKARVGIGRGVGDAGDLLDSANAGKSRNSVKYPDDPANTVNSVNSTDPGKFSETAISAEIPAGYMKLNFGDAQIEDMGPNAMEVQRLYIQKAFKGCGLGTQLMNLALDTARERGLHKVWLGVWEHNEPAKRFYAGKGFVRVGQHDFWQGDDKQTDYLMAQDL